MSELLTRRAHSPSRLAGFRDYLVTEIAISGPVGRYTSVAPRATFHGGRLHELAHRRGNGDKAPGKAYKVSIAAFCFNHETLIFVH